MGRRRILGKVCFNCGSNKTYVDKYGQEAWNKYEGKRYCRKCYNRLFANPKYNPTNNKKWNPVNNPIYSKINNRRKLVFKGKQMYVKENPRKGVCSKCGKKSGEQYLNYNGKLSAVITHIHHLEYHEEDVLKDTIELCNSCHRSEHTKKLV
jgi:hypothetical protein